MEKKKGMKNESSSIQIIISIIIQFIGARWGIDVHLLVTIA